MCNDSVLFYGTAFCNVCVFYCTVLQYLMMVCFLYITAVFNGDVFYCTILQCVLTVCFIIRYCSM